MVMLGGMNAWAAGYKRTLTEALSIDGYVAKQFYNFQNNTPEVLPTEGDLRYRDSGIWGLHNFGSGARSAIVNIPVEEGGLLVLQGYTNDVEVNGTTKNEGLSASTGFLVFDISETADQITIKAVRYSGVVAAMTFVKKSSGPTGGEVKDIAATLDHTAGAQWGSNTGASTVDAEKEHYNNDAASAWSGCAYAKFSFTIPDGATINKATLTYSVNQGGKSGRNDIIYYMKKDFDIDWGTFAGQTSTDLRYATNRAGKAVEAAATGGKGERNDLKQSVTDAVKAIYAEGQNYIILQWTGNAGGADLYGKGSAKAPTLVLNVTLPAEGNVKLPQNLTFPDYNTAENASYLADDDHEWTAKKAGGVWTFRGFNNQNNAWNYIACGRKNTAVVSTITTPTIADEVSNIVITVDATANVEKAELIAIDEFGTESEPIAIENWQAGDVKVEFAGEAGSQYKIVIYSKAGANGSTKISKIGIYADSEALKEAKALVKEGGVAVGKLQAAIEAGDETALAAAVEQFKADNADVDGQKATEVYAALLEDMKAEIAKAKALLTEKPEEPAAAARRASAEKIAALQAAIEAAEATLTSDMLNINDLKTEIAKLKAAEEEFLNEDQTVVYYKENYEIGGNTTGWSTSVGGRFDPAIIEADGNHFLSVNQDTRNNNGCVVTGTVLKDVIEAGKDFTMTFDLKLGSSNNQTPTSLEIKDADNAAVVFSLTATGSNVTTWKVNGTDLTVTLPNSGSNGIADITWNSVQVSRSNGLTYATITNKETGEAILERTAIESSEKGGLGNIVFTTRRYNANFAIDNIVVRDIAAGDVPEITPAEYSIKYVNENNDEIAETIVVKSFVGAEVKANAAQTAPAYIGEKKFLYKEGNNAITLVEDATKNIITLVYREAKTFKYTINAVDDGLGLIQVLKEGAEYEQDVVKFSWPIYVNNNGTLFTKGASNKQYFENITLNQDNIVKDYEYTPTEINNVIFITEGEDIKGASIISSGNSEARSSNAASAYATEDLKIVRLSAGDYTINGVACCPSSGGGTITITDGTNTILSITGNSSNWSTAEANFTLTEETDIIFAQSGSANNAMLDFLYIQSENGKVVEEPVAEGPIYSWESVDGTPVEQGGKITYENGDGDRLNYQNADYYTICLNGKKANINDETASANAGYMLVTLDQALNAGDQIKITAYVNKNASKVSSAYILFENGAEAESEAFGDESNIDATFGNAPTTKTVEVSAEAAGSKSFKMTRGQTGTNLFITKLEIVKSAGPATGINTVKANIFENGAIYNLRGQKVTNPTKGLYIINGKKVVIK